MLVVRVQNADFDVGAEIAALGVDGVGGIGSFVGVVRSRPGAEISALELEHYPGMTEQAMTRIGEEAVARFGLARCTMIHRVGVLKPRENIVFVGAASAHRAAALEATGFLIDWLKTAAPFWKREVLANGEGVWVAARDADDAAAARWGA